jgi:peptidoglycan hydrolase-like protein with peptidoglycan-binding domain
MKRFICAASVLILLVSLSACRKKQDSLEQMQEPISMESLTIIGSEGQVPAASEAKTTLTVPSNAELFLPQSMASKPAITEIQTALQNSGYYKGVVDGKSGPLTKKAITEFQKANGLEPDGKVGSKTWAVLGAYLTKAKNR